MSMEHLVLPHLVVNLDVVLSLSLLVLMLSCPLLLKATNKAAQALGGQREKKARYQLFVHFTFHSEYPRFHRCSLLSLLRNTMSRQARPNALD